MYKYFPPARIDVLKNNLICFSNPKNLNDPFEFHLLIDLNSFKRQIEASLITTAVIEKLAPEHKKFYDNLSNSDKKIFIENIIKVSGMIFSENEEYISAIIQESYNTFNEKFIDNVRVFCVSAIPDNLLMWGHYAASHTGFVLELDVDNNFFHQRRNPKDEFGFLRKVNYQENIVTIDPLTEKPVEHFLVKSKDWEYEKEWRMLMLENSSDRKTVINDTTYDLFKFPKEIIKSVIIGCRATEALERELIETLSNKEYSHVTIYKCERSNEKFKLNILRL
ncbi:DUF2971 domain-containing protein [Serratia fonticola]|uniref:DUF2971 domain-containing protein n=1 Tax=Serratia fonticola TaxID=47917 RepID=UPI003BB7FD8F